MLSWKQGSFHFSRVLLQNPSFLVPSAVRIHPSSPYRLYGCLSKDIRDQFQLPNFHFDNVFDNAIAKYIVPVSADIWAFVNTRSTSTWFFQSSNKDTTEQQRYDGWTSSQDRRNWTYWRIR